MNRGGRSLAAFAGGAAAVVTQTVLVREFLAVFAGNEISLGAVFACWFAGIALGAAVAPSLLRRAADPARALAGALCAMAVVPLAQIVVVRLLPALFRVPAGEVPPLVTLVGGAAFTVAPCGLLVGFFFPAACAAWRKDDDVDDRFLSVVYALEAAGSLFGGILFTFVLLRLFSPVSQLAAVAFVALAGAAGATQGAARGPRSAIVPGILLVSLSAAWIGGGLAWVDRASTVARWHSLRPGAKLVRSVATPYQTLAIGEEDGQTSVYSDGRYAISFPDEYGNVQEVALVLTQHPDPRRVLVLGPAVEDLARYVVAPRLERMDVVDVDRRAHVALLGFLPEASRRAWGDPRVRYRAGDGRAFLRGGGERYDVIWAREPGPTTVAANRFFTREFFRDARSRLAPGGVVATSVPGSANYLGVELLAYAASLRATMREVFARVVVLPGDAMQFLGTDDPTALSIDPQVLASRAAPFQANWPTLRPELFRSLIDRARVADLAADLDRAPPILNTDLRPVTYFFHLLRWDRLAGGTAAPLLWAAYRRRSALAALAGIATAAALLGLAAASARGRWSVARRTRVGARVVVFVAGAASFSLALVLLFVYQSRYGTMVERIGAFVALFMAGASAGAVGERWTAAKYPARGVLASGVALAALSLVAWMIARAADPGEWAFWLVNAAAGAAVGIQFSATGAWVVRQGSEDAARVASRLDCADHLGAMVGAATTGLLAVPILGAGGTCALIAAASLAGAGAFAIVARETA